MLSEEARKKRNEYMKEYRKRNKDKVKEQNEKYWEKKTVSRGNAWKEVGN